MTAVLGAVLGLGITLVALAGRRWPGRRPQAAPPSTVVQMGWRYCPECLRVGAVILHRDGTATCDPDGCGTHIPAPEEAP